MVTATGELFDTTVDGFSLRRAAWNVETFGGLMGVPAKRRTDREIAGVHGVLHIGGEVYEEGALDLKMFVLGSLPDGGLPPVHRRAQMMKNARTLVRLFSRPGLRTVQQETDFGTVECQAKVLDAIDFTTQAGVTRAEFAVAMSVPRPFWRSTADVTQTVNVTSTGQVITLTNWAETFGPQTNLRIELTGSWANPEVLNPETGQWVRYVGSLTGAQTLVLDGFTSTVGQVNALAATRRGGVGTTWLDLDSADAAGPKIVARGTPGSGAKIKVTGRKQYLIP